MTIKLLSKSIHSDLKLGGFDLKVFSDIPSIPIYINEIKHLACDHPLFFHNNKETYELRLLCSLNSPNGSAWITDEGKWVGNYVPAFLRHQPFSAHPTGVGEEVGIFIDDASQGSMIKARFYSKIPSRLTFEYDNFINEADLRDR